MSGPSGVATLSRPQASAQADVAHKASHAAPKPAKLTYNNYVALVNGINFLVHNWKQPGPLNVSPSDDKDLIGRHRGLLDAFRTALLAIKTAPLDALKAWERVSHLLRVELGEASSAQLESEVVASTIKQLDYVWTVGFEPAGFGAAVREAKATGGIEAPDMGLMAGKLKKAEAELNQAKELFEASLKIASGTSKLAGLKAPGEIKEIVELVMLPGTIEEKIEYARKHGVAGTAVELVAKVTGATGTLLKNVGEVGEKVVEARKAILLSRNASKKAIEELEQVAGKFQKLAKVAKTIGKAASYAAVIADGIKMVTALRDGDYAEALKAGKDLAIDAAPLLLGEEVAGPLSVTVVVIQAELEAFHLAAEFIRWCKDEMVREAAEDFVKQCDIIAKGGAYDLVAECQILLDYDKASLHDRTMRSATRHAAYVSKGIQALSSHLGDSKHSIGGYPGVVRSLGRAALAAMGVVFDENDGVLLVAQQIADVFHGANQMARYVKATYTN
jgi:hypothetical protein